MTNVDVTRLATQVLYEGDPDLVVTRLAFQVLYEGDPNVDVTRLALQVLQSLAVEADGASAGETTIVEATLDSSVPGGLISTNTRGEGYVSATIAPNISSVGRSYIQATLDNGFSEFDGESFGTSTVEGDFYQVIEVPYQPVNYPFARGNAGVAELSAAILGVAGVQGVVDVPVLGGSSGTSTTTGTLSQAGSLDGSSTGEGYITAELFVSGAGAVAELEAEIFGDADAYVLGTVSSDDEDDFFTAADSAYYIYGNVITGFNPTDDADGVDGDIVRSFARTLHLYTNINVAFDYTDDVSDFIGFVSQSYPDGDIIRDFARNMHQYLLVIPEIEPPFHRLTIGPAPRSPSDLTPTERPPRKRNR